MLHKSDQVGAAAVAAVTLFAVAGNWHPILGHNVYHIYHIDIVLNILFFRMQQTCIFLANMNMNDDDDDDHDEYIQSATYNFHIGSVDSFHSYQLRILCIVF